MQKTFSAAVAAIFLSTGAHASTVYFYEDFSDNSAGWTLGTEWQIGSATASPPALVGNPDPSLDHTDTDDNGIAGAVIGGNITAFAHYNYYWLTSPSIDLSAASNVELEYWRWLNSDYSPYMTNRVQVFDGTDWQTVFDTSDSSSSIFDNSWTQQTFDVSAWLNAEFRVRFGHQVGFSGAYTVSGWNLDDVKLSSPLIDAQVPLPPALPLLGAAFGALALVRRRKSRSLT